MPGIKESPSALLRKLPLLDERVNFLKKCQFWSKEEILKYQLYQLKKLINHAYRNIPFYKQLYDHDGIKPEDIQSFKDYQRLPFTDKNMLRNMDITYLDNIYDTNDVCYMTSGGSTGNPMKIYMDKKFRGLNHANTRFYLDIAGININKSKNVRLHGDVFPEELIKEEKYWYIQDDRTLIMSSYHISRKTCEAYVNEINNFQPNYIHAFPSSLNLLIHYIEKFRLKIDIKIEHIFCDCECLYEKQRKIFEDIFKCKIYNIYGHTEGACIGITCPESDYLHMNPQVGIFELVRNGGTPAENEYESGEIVVTGFNNYVFPFIRYRTEDIGIHTNDKCLCGRNWPLLHNVEGRIQDYVIDKFDNLIPLASALFDYNVDWSDINRFQVVQSEKGKLFFNIILMPTTSIKQNKIINRIGKTFSSIFNRKFEIDVQIVEHIPLTKIGKYRYLNQKIDIKEYFRN